MIFSPLRACLLVLLIAATPLGAATLRFTATSLGAPITGLEYDNGQKTETLHVPVFQRSQVADYAGGQPLTFFTRIERDGEKQRVPVGRVTLAEGTERALLVFRALPDGTYDIQAFDDSAKVMPTGTARVYNATRAPLGVKCNQNVITLAPGESQLVPADGKRLIVLVAYHTGEKWVRAASNVFEAGDAMRQTIFLTATSDAIHNLRRADETEGRSSLERTAVQMFSLSEAIEPGS